MELFLDVLNTFPGEAAIETKILGLLNNIAEVSILYIHGCVRFDKLPGKSILQVQWLRSSLLVDPFIDRLRELLHSKSIEVLLFLHISLLLEENKQ